MNYEPEMFIEIWYVFAITYFVFCWGIPMLGMTANKWKDEASGEERSHRYWAGVRFFSGCIHVAIVLTAILMWQLNPYMFPAG